MTRLPPAPLPPVGLGVASFVLGFIGLLFFFLPILGIPISLLGLGAGVFGIMFGGKRTLTRVRWALAGVTVSSLALVVGILITSAPSEYIRSWPPAFDGQQIPHRPYVPPPARPGWWYYQSHGDSLAPLLRALSMLLPTDHPSDEYCSSIGPAIKD